MTKHIADPDELIQQILYTNNYSPFEIQHINPQIYWYTISKLQF